MFRPPGSARPAAREALQHTELLRATCQTYGFMRFCFFLVPHRRYRRPFDGGKPPSSDLFRRSLLPTFFRAGTARFGEIRPFPLIALKARNVLKRPVISSKPRLPIVTTAEGRIFKIGQAFKRVH